MNKLKNVCNRIANRAAARELIREVDGGRITSNEIEKFTTFPSEELMAMLEKNKVTSEDIIKTFEQHTVKGQGRVAYFPTDFEHKNGGKKQLYTIVDDWLPLSKSKDMMQATQNLCPTMASSMTHGYHVVRSEETESLMNVRSDIMQMVGGKFRNWKKEMMKPSPAVMSSKFLSKGPHR